MNDDYTGMSMCGECYFKFLFTTVLSSRISRVGKVNRVRVTA